ncbi:MAG: SIMPL domain-containing protein [Chthonomonadaceae bacterium]|nr:SIMPL domain-containing protein [Chthonomonadaceae bacterium]
MHNRTQWLPYVVLPSIIVVGIIAACLTLAQALVRVKSDSEMIRVTGSARKPIRSDFIIWTGSVSRRAPDIASAYNGVTTDLDKVKAYLLKKGVKETEIILSAISTTTLYEKQKRTAGYSDSEAVGENSATFQKIEGYQLSGEVEVRSTDVGLVDQLSRQVSELISSGIALESKSPQYLYTKLSNLKVTMLAEAAKDARVRAEQIAASSGCRIGDVRFARMGILQITPIYSTAVSGEGINDTSSLDKDITAIVTMGYAIR